ncbi:MAG: hypothetical protein DI498_09680 [Paracoccus denitrificans]|nr:MAG: hypothetical protein DI498_09680 [Paracoccus denitrificans]PZO83975.1 MAG: hypothetical protein DI633_09680 [Paracoccus denitrificans]
MIKKLIFPILLLVGFFGGAVGGEFLKKEEPGHGQGAAANDHAPDAEPGDHAAASDSHTPASTAGGHGPASSAQATFDFPQQFFVPIVRDGTLSATMILSLSLEIPSSAQEATNQQEFLLRDVILRQLLIHANTGGFDGNFTSDAHLQALRATLLKNVQNVAPDVSAVLIGAIMRKA